MTRDFIKDVLLGVAVGDAIGVPVEFKSRNELSNDPVTGMRGYGSHRQPRGTWSDDSSLTFCLAEMICRKYDLQDLAHRFINWKTWNYWTPHNEVFDMGIATAAAIDRLARGIDPRQAGVTGVDSNGNGSLMRILPLLFLVKDLDVNRRFLMISDVSSLTHGHVRSVLSCLIYIETAMGLLTGKEKHEAYLQACSAVVDYLDTNAICTDEERMNFSRILSGTIGEKEEQHIHSSGYVLHTLEASLWCLLNTENYEQAVLKATNLGSDTDTTAAVTGGLAGLLYGWQAIPEEWLSALARLKDIEDLAGRLGKKLK